MRRVYCRNVYPITDKQKLKKTYLHKTLTNAENLCNKGQPRISADNKHQSRYEIKEVFIFHIGPRYS